MTATPAPALVPGRDSVAQWGIATLTLVLVAAPLIPILYQSFSDRPLYDGAGTLSFDNYVPVSYTHLTLPTSDLV